MPLGIAAPLVVLSKANPRKGLIESGIAEKQAERFLETGRENV
jgi:hypothetical protein